MKIVNPPTWEDVRARILRAIEEEKRAKTEVQIPRASVGTYPSVVKGETHYGNTANEDSYEFFKATPSAVEELL